MAAAAVRTFHDAETGTCQHVVWCESTRAAAIIDSVLDYAQNDGSTSTKSADAILEFVRSRELDVKYILETHAHADHISAAPYLKQQLGGGAQIGIGERIKDVQKVFQSVFGFDDKQCPTDGSQFDVLFADGDQVVLGNLAFTVMHTPGHTPACIAYAAPGDVVFTGDTIFMPDAGTARCDFPLGSSQTLWDSVQKILALPAETRILTCHDYAPNGREVRWESTVAEERANNIHVKEGTNRDEFVRWRAERDSTLSAPKLIIPSVQANINAGYFPAADAEGRVFLKTPVNVLKKPEGATGVLCMKE